MPDLLVAALATEGLWMLGVAYLVAGVIRGFTGFGTALIVVPVAGIFLTPAQIITIVAVTGIFSNILLLPQAWQQGDRVEVGWLVLAAVPCVTLGIFLLNFIDPTALRWAVGALAVLTILALVSGWRYRGTLGRRGLTGVGAGAGLVGGLTAIPGPIVIIFYLASARSAAMVRANMILFLGALDFLLIANVLLRGLVDLPTLMLAIVLTLPYLLTIVVGRALFDPSRERAYRLAAYTIVALAVITGLPIWE